jgi:hypothetical protein
LDGKKPDRFGENSLGQTPPPCVHHPHHAASTQDHWQAIGSLNAQGYPGLSGDEGIANAHPKCTPQGGGATRKGEDDGCVALGGEKHRHRLLYHLSQKG